MRKLSIALFLFALITAGCGGQEKTAGEKKAPAAGQAVSVTQEISLHAAVAAGDMAAVRRHIEAGSDLNVRDPEGGAAPLSTAALFGRTEAALALIKAGADVNFRGDDGATPLHVAAFFCREEIVKALLDNGADKTLKNGYGSTPLETVTGPFEKVKPVYEHFEKALGSQGLKFDYERIEAARPRIAEMLR